MARKRSVRFRWRPGKCSTVSAALRNMGELSPRGTACAECGAVAGKSTSRSKATATAADRSVPPHLFRARSTRFGGGVLLAQKLLGCFRFHRLREEVALAVFAAEFHQTLHLPRGFDALGDRF